MYIFRIVAAKYASKLTASGRSARWNHADQYVIYCSESRSLATLELLVGRGSISGGTNYRLLVIEVPDSNIQVISTDSLPENWRTLNAYPFLQHMGDAWYKEGKSLLLKVPSAVIPKESNYLINYSHINFSDSVQVDDVENYFWDERLVRA